MIKLLKDDLDGSLSKDDAELDTEEEASEKSVNKEAEESDLKMLLASAKDPRCPFSKYFNPVSSSVSSEDSHSHSLPLPLV